MTGKLQRVSRNSQVTIDSMTRPMPDPFLQGYTPFAHETTKEQVLRHLRSERFGPHVPTGELDFTTPLSSLCSLTRVTKCPIQSKHYGLQNHENRCASSVSVYMLCQAI